MRNRRGVKPQDFLVLFIMFFFMYVFYVWGAHRPDEWLAIIGAVIALIFYFVFRAMEK